MYKGDSNFQHATSNTHFKSLLTRKQARWPHYFLHFFNGHTVNVNYAKFKKKFDGRTISRELPYDQVVRGSFYCVVCQVEERL